MYYNQYRYVCLSVFLSVCLSARITRKSHNQTSPMFVHVACGRGSVLLCRRCDTLCRPTSGFIRDAKFSHNGPVVHHVYFYKRRYNTTTSVAAEPNSSQILFNDKDRK